jgi:hypothetical protein
MYTWRSHLATFWQTNLADFFGSQMVKTNEYSFFWQSVSPEETFENEVMQIFSLLEFSQISNRIDGEKWKSPKIRFD